MKKQSEGNGNTGILLAGDPGVGKTSFMNFFAELVGMTLITIEAPHITEEHIINIPYIVMKGGAIHKAVTGGEEEGEDADYKVVMADSNLYSEITSSKKISDDVYLKKLYNSSDKTTIKIFEELGGDKDTVPRAIDIVRKKYEVILFLDEYYRQTSNRIRNMLRTILDKKIGDHDLPNNTYVAYASNMSDSGGGVEDNIPKNNEFNTITMAHPPKNEWFAWLVNKYEKDEKHKLKDEIVQEFYKLLKDENISQHDVEADVRSSPRRWEQLLTYINSSLPVKDADDAKSLLSNVKLSFRNYKTGKHAAIVDAVLDTTVKLIESTSKIKMSASVHGSSSWRKTLRHQIEQKMKLGKVRTYLPIIAGLPGIGKTSEIYELGKELNLGVVIVNVANLYPEEVTGIPVPKTSGNTIKTKFSMPKLLQYIKAKSASAKQHHIEALKASGDKGAVEEYNKSEWKYLLFFDELNRNSSSVFNSIRRLILEKNLGKGLEIPDGTVMVAALNPEDIGAETLTQHMVDVADVIDAAPSWANTKRILKAKKFDLEHPEVEQFVYDMLLAFVERFHHQKGEAPNGADREYFINVGGSQLLYVSPREYTNLYTDGVEYVDHVVTRVLKRRAKGGKPTAEELRKDVTELKDALYSKFKQVLTTVMAKYEDAPEFMHGLREWFHKESSVDVESMFFSKKANTLPFSEIMKKYMVSAGGHLGDDQDFISYVENSDTQNLTEDMREFIEKEFTDIKDAINKTHKKKILKGKNIEVLDDEVTKFEHLARELHHAFKIHDYDHEKIQALEEVTRELLKKISRLSGTLEEKMAILLTSGAIKRLTTRGD